MAIWSMGSQTQILIGYLPVPAPLLCKYWTSTFFTVTCIWKKKEGSQRKARGGVENRHGWVDMRAECPSSLRPPHLTPRNLQPTSASLSLTEHNSTEKTPSFLLYVIISFINSFHFTSCIVFRKLLLNNVVYLLYTPLNLKASVRSNFVVNVNVE